MIAKTVIFSACLLLCCCELAAAPSPATAGRNPITGQSALQRNTAVLTAKLLIAKLRQQVAETEIVADELYRLMRQDIARHRNISDSQKLLRDYYISRLKQHYNIEVKKVLKLIAERTNTPELLSRGLTKRELQIDNHYLQLNLRKRFPPLFKAARQRLCREQRRMIAGKVYPTVAEVDSLSPAQLRKKLEERLIKLQNFPVLEENRAFISRELLSPIISEALRQRQQQQQIIRSVSIEQGWTPDEFAAAMRSSLQNHLIQLAKSGKNGKVYPIFPSVEKSIPPAATDAAIRRFAGFIAGLNINITAAEMAGMMLKNPAHNRSKSKSKLLLFNRIRRQLQPVAIRRYLETAPTGDRKVLEQFITTRAVDAPACTTAWQKLWQNNLEAKFLHARRLAAQQQLRQFFPTLADYSWTPPASLVENYYKTNRRPYQGSWRRLSGFNENRPSAAVILDSTITLGKKRIDKIFACARQAIGEQYNIADLVADELKKSLQATGQPGIFTRIITGLGLKRANKLLTEENLYEEFINRVDKRWETKRRQTVWGKTAFKPANIATKYRELYPAVKAYIKVLTKAIINDHRRKAKEQSPREQQQMTVNISCDIDIDSEHLTILTISDDRPKIHRQFRLPTGNLSNRATARFFRNLADSLAEKLAPLQKLSRPLQIKITLKIHNGKIFYQLVAQLRRKLRERITAMPFNNLDLMITDKLCD